MMVQNTLWICSLVLLTNQIVELESSYVHLDKARQSKAIFHSADAEQDSNVVPLDKVENKKHERLDELIPNEGLDKVKGSGSVPNSSDTDGFYVCDDEKTYCQDDQTCCPDVDGDGLMECCNFDPVELLGVIIILVIQFCY